MRQNALMHRKCSLSSIKPLCAHMMILPASGWEPFTPLCGRIFVPFRYVSSFTCTSSAMTVRPVTLHHFPTELFQPTMLPSMRLYEPTLEPANSVDPLIQLPGPTLHPGPMTTFGPIMDDGSI